jgi:hypothetical protein
MEIIDNNQVSDKEPAQIFDLTSGKMVDNPDAVIKETAKPEAKPDPKDAKKTVVKPDPEEEEPEAEEPEVEEEEEPEDEPEEEDEPEVEEPTAKKKKEEEEFLTEDQFIEKTYGEKFGIKTQADLDKTITNAVDVMAELETVKKERDSLKSAKPKFTSPGQESAYNFVSQFDPKMQGEALQTFAKLIGMDMESADPTMLLEEKFIHENPQWSRSESQRMFKKEYAKKYNLQREKFDGTDAEYDEELKDIEILKKGDVARSKTFLKELKEKHKPAEEQPKNNELVTKAVEQNVKKYADFVQKAEEVTFGEGDDKFIFKLDAEKKSQLSEAMKSWVNNPYSYDDRGQLLGERSMEEMFDTLVGGMYIKEIVKAIRDQANNSATIKRVDEISTKSPKKLKGQAPGEVKVNKDDLAEQARAIIRRRKAA